MLERLDTLRAIETALGRAPVTVLTGPRQCGKTTLAQQILDPASSGYFDLESPRDLAVLHEPMTALEALTGVVVIDEVQLRPDLFPVLRVLADRSPPPAKFLVLGSASGDLMRQTSESLAGRTEYVALGGFTLAETGQDAQAKLWRRGGMPRSFLAKSEDNSAAWRRNFILTLLQRDFPQWGVKTPAATMERFWNMLAHYHGQRLNLSQLAHAMAGKPATVRRYLDLLTDAMMVRQLQPWFANIRKRQVKSPKIYVRDSGLLHQLLGVTEEKQLWRHPNVGASWEGFAIEQTLAACPHDGAYFWATSQGAEVDLILRQGTALYGVECKRADAPRITPSIRHALADLGLRGLAILYPGSRRYRCSDQVEVVPITALAKNEPLFPGSGAGDA